MNLKNISNLKKKKFLEIISKDLNRDFLIHGKKKFKSRKLLSYISQINRFLKKKGLENKIIIIQIENRLHTLIFCLAAIFSNTTICPLDPKLPTSRVNKIKKSINATKVIKRIDLIENSLINYDLFNLNNHNFLISFSSGTSGSPKGVMHDSNNVLGISFSYSRLVNFNKQTRILHCLPVYFAAGIINTFFSSLCGSSTIIIAKSFNKRNIFNIWDSISKYKVNLVYLVPSIYSMITNFSPSKALNIIKKNKIEFYSTSNNLYPNIRKTFFKKFKKKIKSCYGITEMGGPLTNEIKSSLEKDSVGKLIHGCKIKIKKINGKKNLFFKSIYKCRLLIIDNKVKNIKTDKLGYYNSQDIGYIENKNIVITGREKDILKKRGEFIHLRDIENVIIKCEFVAEVAAVSLEDELSDEKLHVYLCMKRKKILNENIEYLLTTIEKNLFKTEKPDKIIFIRKMPKTSSGKIIKHNLLSILNENKIKEIIL